MNKRIVISMLALIGLSLACFSTRAEKNSIIPSLQNEHPVPLYAGTSNPIDPNSPRAPVEIPISCYLNELTESLCFVFAYPMGNVTITLTEASAGVVSTDDYSSSSCFVAVPVPGPGTYEITILLASGIEYTGQFEY